MRFKEIINEAPPSRVDDTGQSIGPAAGTVAAAQADATRIAQGEKNLNAVKGFFGMKPTELKDAPPGTSIDPIQRSRMGYKPATQQEIDAFQAANPNYGKVVGGDGKPIKTGDGSDLGAGGEKAVVQTAQAAAPQSKGDGVRGGPAPVAPTPISATADAKSSILPPADAGQPEALGMTDAQIAAAAAAGQTPIRDTGDNTQLKSQVDRMKELAGIPPAAAPPQAALPAAAPAAAAPAAAAAAAPESNPEAELDSTILKTRQDQEAAARANPGAPVEPPGFAGVSAAAPASGAGPGDVIAAGVAGAKGREGPITAAAAPNFDKMSFGQAFKAARDLGLPTFPWRKGSYSTAQAGENKALDAGIARNAEERKMAGQPGYDEAGRKGGGKGSAAASAAPAPAAPAASAPAASAPAAPASASSRPTAPAASAPAAPASAPAKPAAPQTGAAGQAARAASGKTPTQGASRQSQSAVVESREINRIRFLAGLSKD